MVFAIPYVQNKFLDLSGEMLLRLKDQSLPVEKALTLPPEERKSRIVTGILHQSVAPEFCENIASLKTAQITAKNSSTGHPVAVHPGDAHFGHLGLHDVYPPDETAHSPGDDLACAPGASDENCWEMRLAGSGGQGVITAGILLAQAAVINGNNAVQTQSYGPQTRGGYSSAEIVIAEGPIDYPEVLDADLLLVMSREALVRYGRRVKPSSIIIVDETDLSSTDVEQLYQAQRPKPAHFMFKPITGMSRELFSRDLEANLIAAGLVTAVTHAVTLDGLLKAVAIQFSGSSSPNITQSPKP